MALLLPDKPKPSDKSQLTSLPWYAWLGLGIIVVSEILLFRRVPFITTWFTPIVWTGYILFADGVVLARRGHSLLHDRPKEAPMMALWSILLWLIFEVYNLRLRNWGYIGLPEVAWQRNLGFAWAFATIFPGIFETADLLEAFYPFAALRTSPQRWVPRRLPLFLVVGLLFLVVPPLLPYRINRYLFGCIWLGFIFLLDPINYRLGAPSLLRDWEKGHPGRTYALLLAGLICGLLWEFWNYWATTKWVYMVPILPQLKLFEMPLLGYLGFPPFALECYIMYNFIKHLLRGETRWA